MKKGKVADQAISIGTLVHLSPEELQALLDSIPKRDQRRDSFKEHLEKVGKWGPRPKGVPPVEIEEPEAEQNPSD